MSAQSLGNTEVTKIAEALAEEAVARSLLKQADMPDTLRGLGAQLQGAGQQAAQYGNQAMQWLSEPGNQGLRYGLAGAGIGGLLGAGSQLMKPEDERQTLSTAMHGAIAGGALGGGLGLMHQNLSGIKQPSQPVDQQLDQVNQQIQQQHQQQQQAANQDLSFRGNVGLAAAPLAYGAAGLGVEGTSNGIRRSMLAGADKLKSESPGSYGGSLADKIDDLGGSLTEAPLRRAWLSAQLSRFQNPRDWFHQIHIPEVVDDVVGGGGNANVPRLPGTQSVPRPSGTQSYREWRPRIFTDTNNNKPNHYMPGFTNQEMRDLRRAGRTPWGKGRYGLVGAASALPLILSLLGSQRSQNAQQRLYAALSGGQ